MRCEECLAVIEEYFDGETDESTSERVDAHLAACDACAEALEALGSEQDLYMRYERELEVSPALWQGVKAEIARTQAAEEAAKPSPLFTRLGGRLAEAFHVLAARPAFASSFALLLLGVAVGSLWLARSPRKPEPVERAAVRPEVKETRPEVREGELPEAVAAETPMPTPIQGSGGSATDASVTLASNGARRVEGSGTVSASAKGGAEGAEASGDIVSLDEHPIEQRDEALIAVLPASAPLVEGDVITQSQLLDPEQKQVARHVEKAQMLLRSFRNVSYSEGGASAEAIAYEKSLSRKLLDENVSLQLEAESEDNKEVRKVLRTLEPFLLDISNLRDRPSREEVRSIKERMERTEIIAALQVYD